MRRPCCSGIFESAARDQLGFSVDYRLRQDGGTYRWVMVMARPHLRSAGEFRGLVGVVVDFEERKRSELLLRRTQQAARFLANAMRFGSDHCEARTAAKTRP